MKLAKKNNVSIHNGFLQIQIQAPRDLKNGKKMLIRS